MSLVQKHQKKNQESCKQKLAFYASFVQMASTFASKKMGLPFFKEMEGWGGGRMGDCKG